MIVDGHCHASPDWYEPVEALLFQMDRCGVDRALLVQMLGQYDNSYQSKAYQNHPDRLGNIVGIDAAQPGACDALIRAVDEGAVGVRLRPQAPIAVWHAAERAGIAVSCVGPAAGFCSVEFGAVIHAVPALTILLEHLGGLARPDTSNPLAAAAEVMALAVHPNIGLKIPGLGQLAGGGSQARQRAQTSTDYRELLTLALASFGSDRLVWGSDFPPVSSREGYANALNWSRTIVADLRPDACEGIFGANAARIFLGGKQTLRQAALPR